MVASQKRLRFDSAALVEVGGSQCRVDLVFSFADRTIHTSSQGDADGVRPLKVAAEAALKAIEEAVEGRFGCTLADLDHVNALGKDLIAVLVNIDFEGRQVQVFGSCQLQGSELETAVKAALNATNRFVELATRS